MLLYDQLSLLYCYMVVCENGSIHAVRNTHLMGPHNNRCHTKMLPEIREQARNANFM